MSHRSEDEQLYNEFARQAVGQDRATDGPQEGHPGELGRPSQDISGRTGRTGHVGILGDQFDRRQVELIICKRCRQEFHSYVDAVLHSH